MGGIQGGHGGNTLSNIQRQCSVCSLYSSKNLCDLCDKAFQIAFHREHKGMGGIQGEHGGNTLSDV